MTDLADLDDVILPGDERYDRALRGQNLAIAHRPRALGEPVRVWATGHGLAAVSDGLVISLARLDSAVVDARAGLATVGGGARWDAVVRAAAPLGLMPVAGASGSVGVAGLLLGGGLGPLARSHGFGSDWVRGFRVVTGEGELVAATRRGRVPKTKDGRASARPRACSGGLATSTPSFSTPAQWRSTGPPSSGWRSCSPGSPCSSRPSEVWPAEVRLLEPGPSGLAPRSPGRNRIRPVRRSRGRMAARSAEGGNRLCRMETRSASRLGASLSVLGIGVAAGDGAAVVDTALAAGVTLIDTADDGAERLVGDHLARRRDVEAIVAPRLRFRDPDELTLAQLRGGIDRARDRLRTDTLDLVQLYRPPAGVLDEPQLYDALDALVDEGAIAAYGVSVVTADEALTAIDHPGVASVQLDASAFRFETVLSVAARSGVTVLARAPAATTELAALAREHGITPAAASIALTAGRPGVTSVIVRPAPAKVLREALVPLPESFAAVARMLPLRPRRRRG
ncbi:MAG: aldo/keto reductase [Microbacteriaceae bacterium]